MAQYWCIFSGQKPCSFWRKWSIAHPSEMEPVTVCKMSKRNIFSGLPTTEKLRNSIFGFSWYVKNHAKVWCRGSPCLHIPRDDSAMPFRNQYQYENQNRQEADQTKPFPLPSQPAQRARKRLKFLKSFILPTLRLLKNESHAYWKVKGQYWEIRAASLSSIIIIIPFELTGDKSG